MAIFLLIAIACWRWLSAGVKSCRRMPRADGLVLVALSAFCVIYAQKPSGNVKKLPILMRSAMSVEADELTADGILTCSMLTMASQTDDVGTGLERVEKWWLRGAWNDGCVLRFADGWLFPWSSNHLDKVEIWSNGKIYPSLKEETPIAELATPLALKPEESEVYFGYTTNDSYLVKWKNGCHIFLRNIKFKWRVI